MKRQNTRPVKTAKKMKTAKKTKMAKTKSEDHSETDARSDAEPLPFFFYGSQGPEAVFSQWAHVPFSIPKARLAAVVGCDVGDLEDGGDNFDPSAVAFSCAEQAMMYGKAARFGDRAAQRAILAETDPRAHKQLGRQVQGFTDAAWNAVKRDVVQAASAAKFASTPELRRALLATGHRLIVEAAPRDRIWGIGFGAANAMKNRDRWGQNLLGQALMAAREELRGEGEEEGEEGEGEQKNEEQKNEEEEEQKNRKEETAKTAKPKGNKKGTAEDK